MTADEHRQIIDPRPCRRRVQLDRPTRGEDDHSRSPVRTREGERLSRFSWIIVAFWIVAIVSTVFRPSNLASLARYWRRQRNHCGATSRRLLRGQTDG